MMYRRETSIGSIIAAFIFGGLIGAGMALLMAPQSGQETRERIRNKGVELKDRAVGTYEETADRAKARIDDISQKAKERTEELRHRGKEMVEQGKESL